MPKSGVFLRTERDLGRRFDEGYDGMAMLAWYEEAEDVLRQRGLLTITELSSMTASEARAAADVARRLGATPPPALARTPSIDQWFDAADGLRAIRCLIDFVKENPEELPQDSPFEDPMPDAVLSDLKSFERRLSAAVDQGVRFYFFVG